MKPHPIDSIFPASDNSLLYRPVNLDDPQIRELADSISEYGLLEPIIITKDHIIASGHRRYAAAQLAGLSEIPCRTVPMKSTDPEFIRLLVTCNQQRVKTLDELMREIIATADPEQSYQSLIDHRTEQAKLNHTLERIELGDYRSRRALSAAKEPMLKAIDQILEDNREFWPLSDRQIHYRLLPYQVLRHASKPNSVYRNNAQSYKDLTDVLTRARLIGRIPFSAIADETRPFTSWDVHQNPRNYCKREVDQFLKGYWRDLLQTQPNHIELIGEKLTIEGSIRPVCSRYTIPFSIGRGYASLDPRYKLVKRFEKSGKEKLILLTLSDFDPDGREISSSFARSLRDDFGIDENRIEPIQVALTKDQIVEFHLLPVMTAKVDSPNYDKFIAQYASTIVHELDALTPAQLQSVLSRAIDSVLDIPAFNQQIEFEKEDATWLDGVRRIVYESLHSLNLGDNG
jgi:hypothetical protein